jgi:hypothetical protein
MVQARTRIMNQLQAVAPLQVFSKGEMRHESRRAQQGAEKSFNRGPDAPVFIATRGAGRKRRLQAAAFAVTESAASSLGQHVLCGGIASTGCLL